MATTWQSVYTDIANVLLESPNGFSLGLITDDQMFTIFLEVLVDFHSRTGINRKMICEIMNFSIGEYTFPQNVNDVISVTADDLYLSETSDFYLSNFDDYWSTGLGTPQVYKRDNLNPQQISIAPAPDREGMQVVMDIAGQEFGIIGSTSDVTVFDFGADVSTPAGYGTWGGSNGSTYIESLNPGYGIPAELRVNTGNVTIFASATAANQKVSKNTYIEMVPDSLVPYLKYGTLAKIFAGDSELKDNAKAQYCATRYEEGCSVVAQIIGQTIPD
jgi:hypothetical protein